MTYTAKGMMPAIGQIVSMRMEKLIIEAEIIDVKSAYGTVRLLVKPVSGSGEQWVEIGRIIAATADRIKTAAINNHRITS